MTDGHLKTQPEQPLAVLVTGPSGAGRSTAVRALEDLGFEVIDNMPFSLLPRLFDGPLGHPLALGLDVRNRDFSTEGLIEAIDRMTLQFGHGLQVLYLDADDDVLVRRYSETRRRHPLAGDGPPIAGIRRDKELLAPIRSRAEALIDTTALSPHDLRAEVDRLYAPGDGRLLGLSVQSFSYKRGLPRGLDLVLDCRFLRNPHWEEDLRALDGRDPLVADYVKADPKTAPFLDRITDLLDLTLPAHKDEGRSHLSIGLGCTGGQHRSVALTEILADRLAKKGWQVSKRHRELDRKGGSRQNARRGSVQ